MTPTTFRIKSFGCQMNVYDGERMSELLAAGGMTAAADGADADLVVLNTCHIREKAADKAYSDVGRLRRDPSHERAICLWVVSDNLLKGAAIYAVQIAEVLVHVTYSMLNFSIRDGQEHSEAVIELKRLVAAYLLSAEHSD